MPIYSPGVKPRDMHEHLHSSIGVGPKGDDGEKGDQGEPGFSPTVSTGDHVITITDVNGPHVYELPTYADEEAARAAAETARQEAEQARQTAETVRRNNETNREFHERQRDDAEGARQASENVREYREGRRQSFESIRRSDETTRQSNETARRQAEQARVNAEQQRVAADEARDQAEAQRAADWEQIKVEVDARGTAEAARQQAEQERASNEVARQQTEVARNSSEQARRQAESSRDSAEQVRMQHEQDRSRAENARNIAESARSNAESERESAWQTMSENVDDAIAAANNAASDIREAAERGDFDGAPGETGPVGPAGNDGFSPTVDVQAITGGHEVTITDADGAHSFDVLDGDPSAPGSITDEMLAPDGIKAQVAQLFGNQPTGTLSGTIDTAADAYAAPPMALVVEGASTQDGTPTPDAPVPILSVDALELVLAGKNLYGGTDQTFTQNRTIALTNNLIAGTYTISAEVTSDDTDSATCLVAFWYVGGGSIASQVARGSRASVTLSPTKPVFQVTFYASNTNTHSAGDTATWKNIQIEAGTTATAYTPYVAPTTVSDLLPEGTPLRSLPDGTKDELHLSYLRPSTRPGWAWYSRELVQRTDIVDLGTLNWASASNGGYQKWYAGISNSVASLNADMKMCSAYVSDRAIGINGDLAEGHVYGRTSYNTVMIHEDAYASATAAEFATHVSGVKLVYPLATPVTTTLDTIELPELPAPTCTVWCDGGSATPSYTMGYVQDTNIVIADLRAALADLATS